MNFRRDFHAIFPPISRSVARAPEHATRVADRRVNVSAAATAMLPGHTTARKTLRKPGNYIWNRQIISLFHVRVPCRFETYN